MSVPLLWFNHRYTCGCLPATRPKFLFPYLVAGFSLLYFWLLDKMLSTPPLPSLIRNNYYTFLIMPTTSYTGLSKTDCEQNNLCFQQRLSKLFISPPLVLDITSPMTRAFQTFCFLCLLLFFPSP